MLEAITVCVNYGDYFGVVAKHNKQFFKKWIVATLSTDIQTRRICKYFDIEYVNCDDVVHLNDAKFNKGALINKAFSRLDKKDWILHIDADIIVPHDFHLFCQDQENLDSLNKMSLYGMHRRNAKTWQIAYNYINKIKDETEPMGCEVGIGFWQMFHNDGIIYLGEEKNKIYTELSVNAAWSDIDFLNQYQGFVEEIKEYKAVHVGESGKNWDGRVTNKFT